MIRDITIGQFYPADSILHRLDPRVKFVGTFLFLISLFVADSFWGYALATLFLGRPLYRISKVPVRFMLKGLKPLFVILLITVLFNLFLIPGEVLWSLGFLKITKEVYTGSKNRYPPDLSGDRFFGYDPYHYAKPADRRHGETPGAFEESKGTGA